MDAPALPADIDDTVALLARADYLADRQLATAIFVAMDGEAAGIIAMADVALMLAMPAANDIP